MANKFPRKSLNKFGHFYLKTKILKISAATSTPFALIKFKFTGIVLYSAEEIFKKKEEN